MLSKRLFAVMNKSKSGFLSKKEFLNGMGLLFTEYFDYLIKFIFNFYDTDEDGIITKEDIRLMLSYLPLKTSKFTFSYKFKLEQLTFTDQLIAQKEIYELTKDMFKRDVMRFDTFKLYITKVDPCPFLYLLVTIFEYKPFSTETLIYYSKITPISLNFINITEDDEKYKKKYNLPLPNLNSKFKVCQALGRSDYLRQFIRPEVLKKLGLEGNDELEHIPFSIQLMKSIEDKKKEDNSKASDIDDSDSGENIEEFLNQIQTKKGVLSRRTNIYDPNCKIYYEGKMYKMSKVLKLKTIHVKIIHNDFYLFPNSNSIKHKSKRNLHLAYLKENGLVQYENKNLFNFQLIFPKKTYSLFIEDENEYKDWMLNIKILIQYKDINEYDIKEKIGIGRYGLIRRAIHKVTKRKVIIKFIEKKNMTHQENVLLKNEIEILKIIKHPNVLNAYDIIDTSDMCYIITEYVSGGDLHYYLEKKDYKIPESKTAFIIQQVACAVFYLHSYGIIHRDIKPEHILIGDSIDEPGLKLIDFGLSDFVFNNEKKNDIYGTIGYIPPEVLSGKMYGKSCDIWCIGVLSYLLLVSCLPFDDDHSEEEIKRMILNEQVPFPPQIWRRKSQEGFFFVENVLRKEPDQRIDITKLLELAWFNRFTKSKISQKRSKVSEDMKFWYYSMVDESQIAFYKNEVSKGDSEMKY